MWIGYCADNNLFKDSILFTLIVSFLLNVQLFIEDEDIRNVSIPACA